MKKYTATIESRRFLEDCEGVPYLKLFLGIDGITSNVLQQFSFVTYSYDPNKLKVGTKLTIVGETHTISSTHHVFIGRLVLD